MNIIIRLVLGAIGGWLTINIMNGRFKINKPVTGVLAICGVIIFYVGFSLISFLAPNPFMIATEEAQLLGNWESEQVQFRHGHYQYSPFGSTVVAQLEIQTAQETMSAHIELSHSPLRGWVINNFHATDETEGAFIPQSGAGHHIFTANYIAYDGR